LRPAPRIHEVANSTPDEPPVFDRLTTGGSIALLVEENFVENTMLRIQRSENGKVVFTLSGRIQAEDLEELHRLFSLETPDRHMVLDLQDVTLVDRNAVKYLARCEARSIELENCPAYIREWIEQERSRNRRRTRQTVS
jgi:hypothetical protein